MLTGPLANTLRPVLTTPEPGKMDIFAVPLLWGECNSVKCTDERGLMG